MQFKWLSSTYDTCELHAAWTGWTDRFSYLEGFAVLLDISPRRALWIPVKLAPMDIPPLPVHTKIKPFIRVRNISLNSVCIVYVQEEGRW